ncbi:MAG: hypothetical protein QCH99_01595 [Candidatus Bathyarchaeota archaeon]|nr:hypothetical protein [Candidatus Bathyarchaeum tardum]WGM89265.1 MAG: hypothetical protein NUK63_10185 [Candidatus Bathyarchaeum tardum]
MIKKHKGAIIGFITLLLIASGTVATILFIDSGKDKTENGKLYSFPFSVGNETYTVNVLSNYSSSPEVSYLKEEKIVSFAFIGEPENSFCNITVPTGLIGGEISVIDKYYKMSDEHYIQSYNGSHNSIYFTFDHIAYVKHFEIRGTQGAPTDSG